MKMEEKYKEMKEITYKDYLEFVEEKTTIIIENVEIKLRKNRSIKSYRPPKDYTPKRTTVWCFPDCRDWTAHKGNYRGS